MWNPTHILVTVQRAKGILVKGKNGTNNCFVTIALNKEKYETSIKEKVTPDIIEWKEQCELEIPQSGNRSELILTCLHRNNLQIDEFLGQVTLPLNELEVYEQPRTRSFKLQSKPGKEKKDKQRGELEVTIAFTVQPNTKGSLADLSKKEKKGSTFNIGGSLLSLGALEKRKGLKNFAKSLGSKVHLSSKKKDKNKEYDGNNSINGSTTSIGTYGSETTASVTSRRFGQTAGDADPGVISEDEDEFVFDNLSHKSSGSSLNVKSNQHLPPALPQSAAPPVNYKNNNLLPIPSPNNSSSRNSSNNNNNNNTTNTNNNSSNVTSAAQSIKDQEDIKLRSMTLPPPSKPPRITPDPPQDEWEAKLYGKNHLDVGSTDSLKRRSWESSRVPLSNAQSTENKDNIIYDDKYQEHILANTAPSTPNLEDQKRTTEQFEKPRPLPRSATLESIEEKERGDWKEEQRQEKKEKSEKRFGKLKLFHNKKDRAESIEDLKSKFAKEPKQQFGGERIIIGHENDLRHTDVKLSQELLKKYEGKSREEVILVANDFEKEVKLQKLKIKEMEDYLDNLLLRVMETHPKILQNPYRTQLSAKSG